jgi:branched-chain amino acid transport system substrate-binding protein
MKKTLITAALLAAGLANAQEVVKIGHSAAVTGPVAYFGKDTEKRRPHGDRGPERARRQRRRQEACASTLVAEDDGGDPKQATNVAQKLVDARVNGVVGHETSGTTIPASKIYHQAGIPQIRHRAPARNTPSRASTPPSAWSPTTSSWARRWATMRSRTWAPNASP